MPRDQQSSIDRLPEDIRTQLEELLRDPRVTQLDATKRINAILKETDHPEKLSKSAVNRYKLKMDKVGEKIRQSREVARMWIGRLGAEPQGEVGKLLNEMVRNLAFDATVAMADGDMPVEPKMLKAEVDIAEIEAAAEVAKAVAKNVSEMFSNTGETLTDLVSMFGDDTTIAQDNAIYRAISEEQENRKKLLEQQQELNDAQVAYLNEKTRRPQSGEALITVSGDGLQPHLEMIMWELFEAIQIRATQEGLDQLNLGA